ncbi:Ultraviolet-B receptor UVR8 [Linum perenne]
MADTAPLTADSSRKVASIAAGEAHTLALTDGCVYSWGRGMFGRLGTGSEQDELFPVPLIFDKSPNKLVGIAAGAYHSLALSDDGSVWCWGYNVCILFWICSSVSSLLEQFHELSSPGVESKEVEAKSKTPLRICSIKAGGMMSLAIDNAGGLWIWGNCPQQSSSGEGGFSLVSSFAPVPVWDLHGHTVVKVACGNEHVVALVSAGETHKGGDLVCYSWGNNNHGQLGLGDRKSRVHPEVVREFNQESPWDVYELSCGAFHTALLSLKKKPSDRLESVCWTFGLGDNGQLGHGTTQSVSSPEPVKELPQQVYLVSIDCGLFHTSVVSSSGYVWSWGMEKGLGLCPDATFTGTDAGDAALPLLISDNGRTFHNPIQVACGAAHTVLVTDGGYRLWSWGRGRSGVLGNGKTIDCYAPSLVLWPPLGDDPKQQQQDSVLNEKDEAGDQDSDIDKRLSASMEEMKLLQSKYSSMEQHASMLHGLIFGEPLREHEITSSGGIDVARQWEDMLESADRSKLMRLERFYEGMMAGVKDKLLKRRIQEIVRECMPPPNQ